MFEVWRLAYTISNENQPWATKAVPNVKKVLTVAASGDQALFYKLAGAEIVDTFDITANARVIQDIKYVAVKNIDWTDYPVLLEKLHFKTGHDIKSVLNDFNLWNSMPDETRKIIEKKGSEYTIGQGLAPSTHPENIPTKDDYAKLKGMLTGPFSFVLSDIASLKLKANQTYDIINISNIFDFCHEEQAQKKILDNLSEYLNANGRIAYLPQCQKIKYDNLRTEKVFYEKTLSYDKNTQMILFQKTR